MKLACFLRSRIKLTWIVWLAPAILFAPLLLAGKALFWGTPSLQFAPWRHLAWQAIRQGSLPLWNQLSGMGAPLLANYQSALLYPPNWLLFFLHALGDLVSLGEPAGGQNIGLGLAAWGQALLVVLHLGWAGWGMVRLARRLGLRELAQAVSGLAYGLCGYLVARAGFLSINAAAAWLPWVILAAEQLLAAEGRASRWRSAFSAGLAIGFLLLSGHAQTAWYSLLLVGLWIVVRGGQLKPQTAQANGGKQPLRAGLLGLLQPVGWLLLAGLMAAALAAAQLLPTGEYLLQSQRAGQVDYRLAMTYSFWPWHFINLAAPGFFGSPVSGDYWGYANYWEDAVYLGLLPLLLAVSATVSAGRSLLRRGQTRVPEHRLILGLVPLTVLSFWLALGENTPLFPWLYRNVPTFDMFQAPARFTLWAEFSLALLAGLGAERWRRPQGAALYWTRLGAAAALAVTLGAGLGWQLVGDVSPTFIKAAAQAGLLGLAAGLLSLGAVPGGSGSAGPVQESRLRRWMRAKLPRGKLSERLLGGKPAGSPAIPGKLSGLAARAACPWHKAWPSLVVGLIAADLLVAGWGLNPGVPVDFYTDPPEHIAGADYPIGAHRLYLPEEDEKELKFERFFRFDTFHPGLEWRLMRAYMLPNLNLLDGTASANNFDPLVPGRYSAWIQMLEAADPELQRVFLNLMDVGVVENVVDTAEGFAAFNTIDGSRRWRWLPCAVPVQDGSQALERVKTGGNALLNQWVVIETGSQIESGECRSESASQAAYTVLEDRPGSSVLMVESQKNGWLLIADTWYPGWIAQLDGEPVQLYRADYLFRAVQLPAGKHRLSMQYQPLSFRFGSGISLAAAVIWLWAYLWTNRRGESGQGAV